jgi:hypothetical protein
LLPTLPEVNISTLQEVAIGDMQNSQVLQDEATLIRVFNLI